MPTFAKFQAFLDKQKLDRSDPTYQAEVERLAKRLAKRFVCRRLARVMAASLAVVTFIFVLLIDTWCA